MSVCGRLRLALDLKAINQALILAGSPGPFSSKPREPVYDTEKAKQLLAEVGYPNGFDASH
jgi:ABC-type transport system substrate-binding protein